MQENVQNKTLPGVRIGKKCGAEFYVKISIKVYFGVKKSAFPSMECALDGLTKS